MSLFTELKRRNVFRVALAYIVLGWLVLQVTDILVPALRLPDWVPSLVIFLGLIGFPFALLFAWAYELTPEGIKPERDVDRSQSITGSTGRKIDYVIIAMLVLAVGVLLVDRFVANETNDASAASYDSIAILPLANLSGEEEQEYFSDGLSENLLNTMSKIPELKVAARTSSFNFKGQQPDPRAVGESLGVETVLIGSVLWAGEQLRVSVQLVETGTGFQIWSEVYDRRLDDVFEVQDDIANRIRKELHVRLTDGEAMRVTSTQNSEAYDHYLKGLEALRTRELDAVQVAQRHFAAATALDPEFAEAWARQAFTTYLQSDSNSGDIPRVEATKLTTTLLERAFELNPDLAEAHGVMALLLEDDYRYEDALAANARALRAQPNFAEAYLWRSSLLESIGRISEADAAIDKAFELDRLHSSIALRRKISRCRFYRPPLSADELESIAASDDQWRTATTMCNGLSGNYAAVVIAAEDPIMRRYIGMWPWVNLKDCDPPVEGRNQGIQRIMALVACRRDEEALAAFEALSAAEQQLTIVLEWISIAQMRMGLYERALATLEQAHSGRVPVLGQTAINGISSNASLALHRVLAYQQLGIADGSGEEILAQVQSVVDNFAAEESARGFRLLGAKVLLLQGEKDAALPMIRAAADGLSMSWYDRYDPILIASLDEELVRELTASIDAHVDGERMKLGWAPAPF